MGNFFSSEELLVPNDANQGYLHHEDSGETVRERPEHHPADHDESMANHESIAECEHTANSTVEEPVNHEAALATMRCFYDTLTTTIQDPLTQLATPLYSQGVIRNDYLERARLPTVIVSERNAQLLDAIERQVTANPHHFFTFLEVIMKDHVLSSLAIELKETYEKFCVDPESMEYMYAAISTSPEVQAYAQYLKEYYNGSSISPEFKWRPPLSLQRFVNLALIQKERIDQNNVDEYTLSTIHGNVDQILKKKEPIAMEEVLEPPEGQQNVKCVLLDGAPGVGKSTFAWELCRKWDDINALKKYSLVLLLRFREKRVQQARTLADLFYHDDTDLQQAVAKEVAKSKGRGLLLILDGYDEFPVSLRTDSLLGHIMRGQSLPKCTLLITSRPSATQSLRSILNREISKHVEALGFSQENIEEYARNVFGPESKELKDFLAYISMSHNPGIRSLMYIPLNSAIVTSLYIENKTSGKPVPQTMTQLYTELCLVLIRRYLATKGDPCIDHLPSKLKDLPQHIYDLLLNLAQTAYKGMLDEIIVFDNLPESCSSLGFTTAIPELYLGSRGVKSYSFLHLTLQEFLAAFYLSQLSAESEECREILTKSSRTFLPLVSPVVHMFLAGLAGGDVSHFGWKMVEVVGKWSINAIPLGWTGSSSDINAMYKVTHPPGQKRVSRCHGVWDFCPNTANPDTDFCIYPFLTRCIYEAQEQHIYDHMFSHKGILLLKASAFYTSFDSYALGHCIAAYECTWSLSFSHSIINVNDIKTLACGLNSNKSVCGKINSLNLEGVQLGHQGLSNFPNVILNGLKSLDISCCYEQPHTPFNVEGFVSTVIPLMSSLQALNISCNPLGENGLDHLLKALSGHPALKTLVMVDNGIGIADLKHLSCMLEKTSLRELRIGGGSFRPMKADCTEAMMKVIFQPSTLQTVNVLYADFGDSDNCIPLVENKNVVTFALTQCVSINSALVQLCKALEENKTLKVLQIIQDEIAVRYPRANVRRRDTIVDSYSIKALSEMIKINDTLQRLELHNTKCCLQDALRLFLSLALENYTLKRFVLPIICGPAATSVGLYHTWNYRGAFNVDRRASIKFDVDEIMSALKRQHEAELRMLI